MHTSSDYHSRELRGMPHNVPACGYEATVIRFHVETGKQWPEQMRFMSRRHMLELLDLWNGWQPGRWQYWSRAMFRTS